MLFVARSGLFTCTRTAVVLWIAAVGLLAVDTYASGHEATAWTRWSILLGIAAGTATVAAVMHHNRRVVLDVVSFEHRMTRDVAPQSDDLNVILLARRDRVSR